MIVDVYGFCLYFSVDSSYYLPNYNLIAALNCKFKQLETGKGK
jgi:hypothetical protein